MKIDNKSAHIVDSGYLPNEYQIEITFDVKNLYHSKFYSYWFFSIWPSEWDHMAFSKLIILFGAKSLPKRLVADGWLDLQ